MRRPWNGMFALRFGRGKGWIMPILCLSVAWASSRALAGDARYMRDFEYLRSTVGARSAALRRHKIDWKAVCATWQPVFSSCTDDVDHVKNIMALLATLLDSHTGVIQTPIDWNRLPSKWDGLYGGGLWFAWENGRVMLRGIMKGHPLEKTLPLGSALIAIEGQPAWYVVARERQRIARHQGVSSDHSLFASMGNRFLPFGDKREIGLTFLTPDLKAKRVTVARWGPGGQAFYPYTVQCPEGLEQKKGAASVM
ncbi:MAG: hypothetical protein JXP34_17260, partial [Planctomycetes bacterium]|nr:hypothetical protein [Planctomycetota bacterium]